MPTFRKHDSANVLTYGALLLMFCGAMLALQDVQWLLVSMASFHAGVVLTAVALCLHGWRRHRAWRLEFLILVILGLLVTLAPLTPLPFQDFLEYLTP
jgi:hypothetical protein